jgi:hypothetical protein
MLSMTTSTQEKVRENRLRRMAERQGLALHKSRRRDRLAKDYGLYWVVDPRWDDARGEWPPGEHPAPGFPWSGGTLDDVEEYLTSDPDTRR